MSFSVRVVHTDATTETLTHLHSERRENFNRMDLLKVKVPRSEASTANLEPDYDEVYLVEDGTDVFGGILGDIDRRGEATVTLIVDSFERIAKESEPCGADVTYTNSTDTTIINAAITDMSGLTAGTVENVKSNLTFTFNHNSPARRARMVRDATGGELAYNADKTVDYVASRGSARNTTLSPEAQNVAGFKVKQDGGQERITHLRLIGSGEGGAQVVVNVTAPSYTSGREVWDTIPFKDIADASTLTEIGNELIAEREQEPLEVNATVKDVAVNLGDTFPVRYDEEGVDERLRVVEVNTVVSNQGTFYEATLSNRNLSRMNVQDKVTTDVERLNRGTTGANIGVYDDPTNAPATEGRIIYVTGSNASYNEGIWRHDGSAYTNTHYGDVQGDNVHATESLVVPSGTDQYDVMTFPLGTDKYAT